MQKLVAGLPALGTGSGGPKRQPAFVQVRELHVSAALAAARVSELPEQNETLVTEVPSSVVSGSWKLWPTPPKYKHQHARVLNVAPAAVLAVPQFPAPMAFV